jgi:hypothetical protein
MRPFLLLTLLLTIMTDCSQQSNSSNDTFNYKIEFSPSFMPPCKMDISGADSTGQLRITIYEMRDTTLIIRLLDSVKLGRQDFDNFFHGLGDVDLLKVKTNPESGLDGIGVDNFIIKGAERNEFHFWSPRKGTKEHKIIEALMQLSRKHFADLRHIEYFESLEQYFDFPLPCKITSRDPWEIRIYGALSVDEESTRQLTQFLDSLPSDKAVLVDMTNFQGMGTLFYPLFRDLIRRNEQIVWVTRDNTELLEIGVDKSKIVNEVAVGRQMIQLSYGSQHKI